MNMLSLTEVTDWKDLYPFRSQHTKINGLKYHYIDEGEGFPVVMLHGNPTWSFYYRTLADALQEHFRVIAPDHMGCGLSDKPENYDYSLTNHISNLRHLLNDQLGLEKMSLVMHEWGAPIGLGFAVEYPEKIDKIVLMNSAAFLLQKQLPTAMRLFQLPLIGQLAVRRLNAFARGHMAMSINHKDRLTDATRAGFLAPYNSFRNRIGIQKIIKDSPRNNKHPTWQTISYIQKKLCKLTDKEVMILWGEKDPYYGSDVLEKWLQYFPHAAVHRFPDAAHYVLEDAYERIIPICTDFLE